MLSQNEWSPLKSVIVGTATNAKIPPIDKSMRCVNFAGEKFENIPASGYYPRQVINEANEDLEVLCDFLRKENIEVYRPDDEPETNYYNYCPRDSVITYKNKIICCPQPLKSRKNDYKNLESSLQQSNAEIVRLKIERTDELYNKACLHNKDILALTESEPAFDAANVLKANDEILYLVSNSGNEAGADLLQETLGTSANVHKIKGLYSFMHIDSTITLLREGLVLLNPARVKSIYDMPSFMNNWDVIWCPQPYDIGHYPGYCNASAWLNMNLLSVNENLVVLEQHQHGLRKELEKYKIDCAMLPGRHQRTLGGGFHCVTLDIERKE